MDARPNGLRVSAYDQERREPQRQLVNLADPIMTQIEFIEVTRSGHGKHPYTQDDFRCIFFSHKFIQNALDYCKNGLDLDLLIDKSKMAARFTS